MASAFPWSMAASGGMRAARMPTITRYLGMDPAAAQDQFAQRAAEEVGKAKPIVGYAGHALVRQVMF